MKKIFLAVFFLVCFSGPSVFAQWVRTAGPANQYINDLAILDNFQIAVNDKKVFGRTGGAGSWDAAVGLPADFEVYHLHHTATAAFVDNNIPVFYRTQDGHNWSPLTSGDPNSVLYNLFPVGNILFASLRMNGPEPYQYKLFSSVNDGDTWTDVSPSANIYFIDKVIKEGDYFRVYFRDHPQAGGGYQVYLSPTGNNWTPLLHSEYIPTAEFAGRQFLFYDAPVGAFRYSDNAGANWSSTQNILQPEGPGKIAFRNDTALFACFLAGYRRVEQIYRTYDGQHWTALSLPSLYSRAYPNGNDLYAIGDYNQVYVSADNGNSWQAIGNPLPADFESVGMIFQAGQPVVFGIGGIYNFSSSGSGIADHAGIPPVYFPIGDIVKQNDQLIAGSYGLFRSGNQGDSWEKINQGLARLPYVFYSNPLLYASDDQLTAGGIGRLVHSYDGGDHWESTGSTTAWRDEYGSYCALTGLDDTLFAVKYDSSQFNVYRSYDAGNNWEKITPTNLGNGGGIYYSHGKLLLGRNGGTALYVSSDHGATWTNYNSPMFSGFRSFSYNNGQYWAGGFAGVAVDKRVLRSTDGQNWESVIFDSLPGQFTVTDILTKDSLIVIATESKGVFASLDNGQHWSNVTKVEPAIFQVLSLEMDDNYLYIGTDKGIWRHRISNITSSVGNLVVAPAQPMMIVPNPASETVRLDLPSENWETGAIARLRVFDTQGRKILEKPYQPGESLPVANFPAGVYFLHLTLDKRLFVGQFVKM